MVNSEERFKLIKAHFEKEAVVFDRSFFKVMPHYEEMTKAVVEAIPFQKNDKLQIIDLGCGTGNLTKKLAEAYPKAHIMCVDMAENMLKMAKTKLGHNRNIRFWQGDVRDYAYPNPCDVIVASMVLHHVEGNSKPRFYQKLYHSLSQGGVFFAIDIFLSPSSHLQKLYMAQWRKFMRANGLPVRKINDLIARHYREDRPVVFEEELSMLCKAGFQNVDVVLKHYNFAVYGGTK